MNNAAEEIEIDPRNFEGGCWINHHPTTRIQEQTLGIYLDAKKNGRLKPFTVMSIDPTVINGKLVYQKGMPIVTGYSDKEWKKMARDYNPSRNSRQTTLTEYVIRNIFLINKLIESENYEITEAWEAVCDNSSKLGHFLDSKNSKPFFEPTGSRNISGFYDLGNVSKIINCDPWEKQSGYRLGGGVYFLEGYLDSIADVGYEAETNQNHPISTGVVMISMDAEEV